jgi:hypothetical protein
MKGSINTAVDELEAEGLGSHSLIPAVEKDRVIDMQDVEAGESFCQSNVPGLCRAAPKPGKHVCHAVLWLHDGRTTSGNFYIDDSELRAIRFMSDAQRRANGM